MRYLLFTIGIAILLMTEASGQTADEQVIREQARLSVAKMGKDACVQNNVPKQKELMKFRMSVGDLCSCVQSELVVLLPDKLVKDIAVANVKAQDGIEMPASLVDEFMRLLDAAELGCLSKLGRSR